MNELEHFSDGFGDRLDVRQIRLDVTANVRIRRRNPFQIIANVVDGGFMVNLGIINRSDARWHHNASNGDPFAVDVFLAQSIHQ